jgi:hypothetical protein
MYNSKEILAPDEVERRVQGGALPAVNSPEIPLSPGAIEARRNLETMRRLAAQKETAMPDIKSEMSKVLREWDDTPSTTMSVTAPAAPVKEKSGSTLKTFNCVKNNPGKTRQAICDLLRASGVKLGSATSLLSQMVDRGNIRDVGGLLYVAQDEYVSVPRRRQPAVVAVEPPVEVVAVVAPAPAEWSVSDVVDKLSVRQAREVLNELKVLFGEAL